MKIGYFWTLPLAKFQEHSSDELMDLTRPHGYGTSEAGEFLRSTCALLKRAYVNAVKETPDVIYCEKGQCDESKALCYVLRKRGFKVRFIDGSSKDYPLTSKLDTYLQFGLDTLRNKMDIALDSSSNKHRDIPVVAYGVPDVTVNMVPPHDESFVDTFGDVTVALGGLIRQNAIRQWGKNKELLLPRDRKPKTKLYFFFNQTFCHRTHWCKYIADVVPNSVYLEAHETMTESEKRKIDAFLDIFIRSG